MKFTGLVAAAATAQLAAAHTFVHSISVNGKDLGRTVAAKSGSDVGSSDYIRSIKNNNPVKDVKSSAMTCNTPGAPAPEWAQVPAGAKVTIQWVHDKMNGAAGDDVIAGSHKGPVQAYIAPAASEGKGNVWVKFATMGNQGGWATDRLIAAKGKWDVTLPNLAPGRYLLRPEIVALHEGNRQGGAQLYMECIQIEVTGSGSAKLPAGIAIPGAYSASDKGILYDVYNGGNAATYTAPGGPVVRI